MARQPTSVKKYVVRLNGEERAQLEGLIGKGKGPAKRLLKARILLNVPKNTVRSIDGVAEDADDGFAYAGDGASECLARIGE